MRQDIKERIEQFRQGEVPDGYKHERGYTIPLDWNFQEFAKNFFRLTRKNAISCERVLTISAQQGLIDQKEFYNHSYASEDKSGYYLLKKGEFAYNRSYSDGYPFGAIKRLDRYKKGVVSPLYICFALRDKTNSEFFAQYFESGRYNREIYKVAQEGARNHGLLNVGTNDFFDGIIVMPPATDQNRISEILACCNKAIDLKKQLIGEKRKQKKWLIQNLLDPSSEVQLTGFEESTWQTETIGTIANVCTGATPSTAKLEYWNGNVPWMSSGELNLKYVYDVAVRISELGLKKSGTKLLPKKCVLIGLAGQGKTRGTVAINYIQLCTNQSIAAILPNNNYVPEYLYHNLDSRYEELRKLSSGDGQRGGLNLELIRGIAVSFPSFCEQTAIANVLSTADREIELLEQELAEWQAKKKALMQLLLTGLVRV